MPGNAAAQPSQVASRSPSSLGRNIRTAFFALLLPDTYVFVTVLLTCACVCICAAFNPRMLT
jgi:hypothetical protein